MDLTLKELTKDISKIDFDDILSCWQWLIKDMKAIAAVSVIGDVFFIGNDKGVYWMQTDTGTLSKIAANPEQFEALLADEKTVDNWFLPGLVEQLLNAGKTLKENQVYSYKLSPAIGGDYSVENLEPTDMSVHFAFAGQICEQVQNLPDGTKLNITFQKG
ncbi:T6SS immunity protein Tdi1 domain-containing protein [Sediminibacterium ginsengisoli]|uniref:T6SS immunity protein Tdi1 C-terminal domain-containing protein n=1 Tax=Sediminibacterium ginsengisoli TaxID=413434 RepID=A0A1T4R001_9BACT|nr:T6SS immunity protein Tdi1 domain-containing protein [Sediminibacterium ginsengisoli]SKA09304.1 protein of unknown function [Sediminibacterium ginsengisoli]